MSFSKVITPNDRGLNPKSHQSGIAFGAPSNIGKFDVFPELSLEVPNDNCVVEWNEPRGRRWRFRWIYFNGKFHGKTRNEYRITQGDTGDTPKNFLNHHDLKVGDSLVFRRLEVNMVAVEFVRIDRVEFGRKIASAMNGSTESLIDVGELLDTERQSFVPSPYSLGTGADMVDPSKGWIYVLENSAMPGLCKIGFTTRAVEKRVDELSAGSGIPTPFNITAKFRVRDPQRLERVIHAYFEPYRLNSGREFFRIATNQANSHIDELVRLWTTVRPL